MATEDQIPAHACCGLDRRRLLTSGLAAALVPAGGLAEARAATPGPAIGDVLVYISGPRPGQVARPEDLPAGGPPVMAWPMTPHAAGPKNGSRLNQILLIKLASGEVAAYSAICTHAGCVVAGWIPQQHLFECPCHNSEYDPERHCKVVFGPAPRPLPSLPVKIADGQIRVAGPFSDRLGGDSNRMD
jgi:rieske iron-sulfur protein